MPSEDDIVVGGPVAEPSDGDTKLGLYFSGTLADRMPVSVLAEKLQAAQRALFNIATAVTGGGRRGSWRSEVLAACQLHFVAAVVGSLDVEARVPEAIDLMGTLEDPTLGVSALQTFGRTSAAIAGKSERELEVLFPDRSHRSRILKSFLSLMPEDEADYALDVTAANQTVRFTSDLREFVAFSSREEETTEEAVRTVTGKLFRIEVSTGQRQLGLLVDNRQIVCFYPAALEDAVKELMPGSLVEVEGRASFGADGRMLQIEEVFDAKAQQIAPLYWKRIALGDREFRLQTAINIEVDFRDGLWVHEFSPLGIVAYARTRKESLEAFRMEFASIWDFVASEDDSKLTVDAILLKRAIKKIVANAEGGA